MCTLTIYRSLDSSLPHDARYGAMMNRDERYEREEGEVFVGNDKYYPTDKQTGGTWAGANRAGLMLFLLNRYELEATTAAVVSVSRGGVIPFLLGRADSVSEALVLLETLPLSKMAPFTLILQDSTQVWRWDWTGCPTESPHKTCDIRVCIESFCLFDSVAGHCSSDVWPTSWHQSVSCVTTTEGQGKKVALWMVSSSSVETQRILAYRQQLFYNFWRADLFSVNRLCRFHQTQKKGLESESICMARPKSHTKSWAHFYFSPNTSTLKPVAFDYLPQCQSVTVDSLPSRQKAKTFTPWLQVSEFSESSLV